ncbi:GNAT family N-acetyltransferase [Mesorhizobium loti]|uniref:Probable N-acetyltransferase n=1 Tax=Rhizobium loti TaxID=381 RepID=M5AMV3_RHILI|nr:probable N-acetyltransferase [Mesorhizobium loti NZP2037]
MCRCYPELSNEENIVKIRVVQPSDLSQLRKLCDEHIALEGSRIADRDLSPYWNSAFFRQPTQLYGWVCDEGGDRHETFRGYMTASIRLWTWSSKPHLYLDCIYLQPNMRRSGVGREMFGVLTEFARAKGCEDIQWRTLSSNEAGMAFYHSIGAVAVADTTRWSEWSLRIN